MKRFTVALFVLALMVAGGSAFAAVAPPTKMDVSIIAGYPVSYLVAPSAALKSFLSDHGVNLNADKATITKEIGALASTVMENPINGEKYQLRDTLDALVNADLIAARQQTGDTVYYMELGAYRWTVGYDS